MGVRTFVVRAVDDTQPIYAMGLRWGVYMLMMLGELSPVALGFFYDKPVADSVCDVMNDGGWHWNEKVGAVVP